MIADPIELECKRCGYSLTGLTEVGRCPECGNDYNKRTHAGTRYPPTPEDRADRLLNHIGTFFLALLALSVFSCFGGFGLYLDKPGLIAIGVASGAALSLWAVTNYLARRNAD